jgi:hypothetical protein
MTLSFFCLTHVFVLVSFALGSRVSPLVAPIALVLALVLGDWLSRREGLSGRRRLAAPTAALGVVGLGLLLAAAFFDLSWDGLWYHQTAVYQMSHGWNPIKDPMREFTLHLHAWLRYYSKGPWYFALALYETTGHIEWAKAGPWLAVAAMFFAVFPAALDLGMRRRTAAVVAALVSLNPVVVCQLASFLVDGLLISFLACFAAAVFRFFKQPSLIVLWVATTAAVLSINSKLTASSISASSRPPRDCTRFSGDATCWCASPSSRLPPSSSAPWFSASIRT